MKKKKQKITKMPDKFKEKIYEKKIGKLKENAKKAEK